MDLSRALEFAGVYADSSTSFSLPKIPSCISGFEHVLLLTSRCFLLHLNLSLTSQPGSQSNQRLRHLLPQTSVLTCPPFPFLPSTRFASRQTYRTLRLFVRARSLNTGGQFVGLQRELRGYSRSRLQRNLLACYLTNFFTDDLIYGREGEGRRVTNS